jgi:hypothetical protein
MRDRWTVGKWVSGTGGQKEIGTEGQKYRGCDERTYGKGEKTGRVTE